MDRQGLKRRLRGKVEAALDKAMDPAHAPGKAVRFKGVRPVGVLSAAGELVLKRRYFWGSGAGGCYPSDQKAGIAASAVTAGARELCCVMGLAGDFRSAAANL